MPESLTNYDALVTAALALPANDRMRLIDTLVDAVPEDQATELHPDWLPVLEQRDQELAEGRVKGEDWEKVRSRLFKRAGLSSEG
ncbi:addiction module protein [Adhaeretor mobilis]|uniref:Addiction module component n=1 Tax=Adhaeretor mobilis TaxID=1930276 RepID=A0A517N1X6_9BACT|nr:addiction module protein [Adhaeretor mobilis]QDT01139.1 Putative addiction module component [Adhaeretor mobilis]